MSKFIEGDPTTVGYWNYRVRAIPNEKDMLFIDGRREEYWQKVRDQLSIWTDKRVLDVACGYGQFANIFNKYTGVDFSDEMLKLAAKNYPTKTFICSDIKEDSFDGMMVDVVFEVNSLRSLNMKPEHFFEKFKPYAKEYIACLEADVFTIYPIYAKT